MKRPIFLKAWLTHLGVVLVIGVPGWVLIRSLLRKSPALTPVEVPPAFFWLIGFGALVATVLAFWLSENLRRPVQELHQMVRSLLQGHTQTRLLLHREDEFQPLIQAVNEFVSQIYERIAVLEERTRWFESLVSSMTEGIVVIRQGGRILFANPAFRRMVQQDQVEGRPYWEVLRAPGFEEIIGQARRVPQGIQREIRIGGRMYECWAKQIEHAEEMVLVFHDVTTLRETQRMKRDFVANVSHELRTPLTAIKGFLETLAEEKDTLNPRYLEIIQRHTDRLIRIVEDLLTLSRLEDPRTQLDFEPLDLREIVQDIVQSL